MPNTIAKNVTADGRRNYAVVVNITGDGSGDESGTVLVDVSAMAVPAAEIRIDEIQWNFTGFSANLLWDATADVLAYQLYEGEGHHQFCPFGGIPNNAGTGKTGDLLITTVGLGNGDKGTLTLYCTKRETDRL